MLFQIILRTTLWVWGLFALLLWQGLKATRPNDTGLLRVTRMPVAATMHWPQPSGFFIHGQGEHHARHAEF